MVSIFIPDELIHIVNSRRMYRHLAIIDIQLLRYPVVINKLSWFSLKNLKIFTPQMIAKRLTIKDRYNGRGVKFDDALDFKPVEKTTLKKLLSLNNGPKTPYSIVKYGLKSEASAKTMEKDNTLIFICDVQATKPMIKAAIEELYGAKVVKVNTLNVFKRYEKKAFVKFAAEGEAVEVATKAGII